MRHREIIVGDVHGMLYELHQILTLVELDRDLDTLVLVGDLLDKGPDSAGVVRLLRDLREQGFDVVLVRGNHEEKHERYRRAMAKSGGRQPDMKGVEEMAAITAQLSPEDINFLETAVSYYRLKTRRAVVVHAGIPSDLQDLDRAEKKDLAKMLRLRHVTGKEKVTLTVEIEWKPGWGTCPDIDENLDLEAYVDGCVLKKVIRPKGEFVTLGQEGPDDPFWAEIYDGRFGHVYFGHEPFTGAEQPRGFPFATGLDLGCVFGGRLACAVLGPGAWGDFVSVPASGKFCNNREE